MRKQHLDLLALIAGLLELRRPGKLTRVVSGLFVDAAQDIARRHVGAALRLEFAVSAVRPRGAVLPYAVMGVGTVRGTVKLVRRYCFHVGQSS
jgi:hypothetical protein